MKNFIYIGIDQTGAVDRNGKPRPLPACFIRNSSVTFFYLSQFSKAELIKQIKPAKNEELIICVDCVLGLPRGLKLPWRKAIKLISKYDGYGMNIARIFFSALGKGKVHHREIEFACNANSVFKEKPFQKNIQTGTFRIWKDISLEADSFYVPAVEKQLRSDQIMIFEGYPSLSWRILLGSPNRKPLLVSKLMKANFPRISFNRKHHFAIQGDPNIADALLLALTMKRFRKSALSLKPCIEGWILGF